MIVTSRLLWGIEQNGGEFYLYATWDSPEISEEGVPLDPNATGLVSSIRYKNMGAKDRTLTLGGRTYLCRALTPETTLNIPTGQRPDMLSTPWSWT